jgi:hypothetical protein
VLARQPEGEGRGFDIMRLWRRPAVERELPALTSSAMPSRIVTYTHRYKRPPKRKAQAAAITGTAIVEAASKRDRIIRRRKEAAADDDQEASPEIKALVARMMRPPGT